MKLSSATIQILKNFASINSNIYISPGSVIKTRNVARNVFAQATIEEAFDSAVCLYDLGEFLAVLNIGVDVDIQLKPNHVLITWNNNKLTYNFADVEIMVDAISASSKTVTMPAAEVVFDISADMLASIQKAASILKTQYLNICSIDGVVGVKTYDKDNINSNSFQVVTETATKYDFNMRFDIENLKLLAGSYTVSLSRNKISEWKKKDGDVIYYIAMDPTSTFE